MVEAGSCLCVLSGIHDLGRLARLARLEPGARSTVPPLIIISVIFQKKLLLSSRDTRKFNSIYGVFFGCLARIAHE